MIRRSRRAPLLAACAYALAVASSALAGDLLAVAVSANLPPTAPQIHGILTSPEGQRMAAELSMLETALVKHLKGEQPATFEALNAKRLALKTRIDAAQLNPGDRKTLDDRLGRSASIIARSLRLNGGAAVPDREVSKAMLNAHAGVNPAATADPLFAIDSMLGDLEKASANPDSAEHIFDALSRRYGSPAGPKGGMRVDFGAIRKTLASTWSYTPKGAPGTNEAKARNLARDTPAPAREPAVISAESRDFIAEMTLSAGRAANSLSGSLPDGVERAFVAERGDRLKELFDAGRLAHSALGGDPNTFSSIDDLVAHLVREEAALASSLRLADTYESMDEIILRITAIKASNRDLGAFLAVLWEYRGFLRESLVAAKVPLNTKFTPVGDLPRRSGDDRRPGRGPKPRRLGIHRPALRQRRRLLALLGPGQGRTQRPHPRHRQG